MRRFYYQFLSESELGKKFMHFHHECVRAEEFAERYAKKMGALSYYSQPSAFAGGVVCVEFGKKVDLEMWRFVMEVDGHQYYEPNCLAIAGCVPYDERFVPSDTSSRIYQKKLCAFDDVQQFHTLKEWATIARDLCGDKEKDTMAVCEILKDRKFLQYIDYTGTQKPKKKGNKVSRALQRAIRAEQQRMKLPVIPMSSLYDLLQADTSGDEPDEPTTPTFFSHGAYYYISLNYPCNHSDLQAIAQQKYTYQKNVALLAIKRGY